MISVNCHFLDLLNIIVSSHDLRAPCTVESNIAAYDGDEVSTEA